MADGIVDAGDDGASVEQGAAKADQQALLVRTHFQCLDIEPGVGLDVAYRGGGGQHRMRRGQSRLDALDNPRCDHVIALDAEADKLVAGFLFVAVAVARVGRDGIDEARAIQRDSFEVVQLGKAIVLCQCVHAQRLAADTAVGTERDQAERVLLLVFDDEEAPVLQLLDGGRFMDAGQFAEHGLVVLCRGRGFCGNSLSSNARRLRRSARRGGTQAPSLGDPA
jgi:hypothetical protein